MYIVHVAKIKGIAGAEGHLLQLLPELQRTKAEIHLEMLVLDSTGKQSVEFVEALQRHQITVKVFKVDTPFDVTLITRLSRYLQSVRPDIVHTHMIHADFYGTFAARVARVGKVVSSRHNQDWFRTRFPFIFLNPILWVFINKGIVISEAVKAFIEKTEMGATGKLRVIHYGLDLTEENSPEPERRKHIRAEWGISAEAPLIGSICRLIEQKGLSYALTAFAEVSAKMPEAHYVIAGDGNLRRSLEQQARDLHLEDRVHFVGWRKDIHAILDAIDVLVAPSLWEGFGLVLLEAMAHALPIIGTTAGALPEIIVNEQTGFLVEPGQSAPLVDPMIHLLSDRNSRLEMGRAGQQRLETMFSVEKMINSTITFYRELYETT